MIGHTTAEQAAVYARRIMELEKRVSELTAKIKEQAAAEDAYGCGFYGTTRWITATETLYEAVGIKRD